MNANAWAGSTVSLTKVNDCITPGPSVLFATHVTLSDAVKAGGEVRATAHPMACGPLLLRPDYIRSQVRENSRRTWRRTFACHGDDNVSLIPWERKGVDFVREWGVVNPVISF